MHRKERMKSCCPTIEEDGPVSSGSSVSLSMYPRGLAVDSNGTIYFSEAFQSKIRKFNRTYLSSIIDSSKLYVNDHPAKQSFVSGIYGQTMDSDGNFYYSESDSYCVKFYNMTSQTIRTVAGKWLVNEHFSSFDRL